MQTQARRCSAASALPALRPLPLSSSPLNPLILAKSAWSCNSGEARVGSRFSNMDWEPLVGFYRRRRGQFIQPETHDVVLSYCAYCPLFSGLQVQAVKVLL